MPFRLLGYKILHFPWLWDIHYLIIGKMRHFILPWRNGLEAFPMKYPWPLWVYPILLACLGQSGFCLLGLLWP